MKKYLIITALLAFNINIFASGGTLKQNSIIERCIDENETIFFKKENCKNYSY